MNLVNVSVMMMMIMMMLARLFFCFYFACVAKTPDITQVIRKTRPLPVTALIHWLLTESSKLQTAPFPSWGRGILFYYQRKSNRNGRGFLFNNALLKEVVLLVLLPQKV